MAVPPDMPYDRIVLLLGIYPKEWKAEHLINEVRDLYTASYKIL